jgi:hypothetical protein
MHLEENPNRSVKGRREMLVTPESVDEVRLLAKIIAKNARIVSTDAYQTLTEVPAIAEAFPPVTITYRHMRWIGQQLLTLENYGISPENTKDIELAKKMSDEIGEGLLPNQRPAHRYDKPKTL